MRYRLTSLEIVPRLFRNVVVVPREFLVEHAILFVDPGDISLVFVVAFPAPLLSLVQTAQRGEEREISSAKGCATPDRWIVRLTLN